LTLKPFAIINSFYNYILHQYLGDVNKNFLRVMELNLSRFP